MADINCYEKTLQLDGYGITGDISAVSGTQVSDSPISERQFPHPINVTAGRQRHTTQTCRQCTEPVRTEVVITAVYKHTAQNAAYTNS